MRRYLTTVIPYFFKVEMDRNFKCVVEQDVLVDNVVTCDVILRTFNRFEFKITESAKRSIVVCFWLVCMTHTTFDIDKCLREGVDTLELEFTIYENFIDVCIGFKVLL